jgi:hypothetical protein
MVRSEAELLEYLHRCGATGVERVTLRRNRSTLWSLTGGGRRLNLHAAYAGAPGEILQAIALLCRRIQRRDAAWRDAAHRVREWPGALDAARRLRTLHHTAPADPGAGLPGCCATTGQRVHLVRLYRYLNAAHFADALPSVVPIRLSRRFRSRLGQMVPGRVDGRRVVLELVLNLDLMLAGNDAQRVDTLLHEMAHAAEYLETGVVGHGPGWRRWARRAGCDPRAVCRGTIRFRRTRSARVSRVPPLPPGWREASRRHLPDPGVPTAAAHPQAPPGP